MLDFVSFTIVFVTFVVSGLVKGVIGMGLPTVSLAILTVAIDLPTAMVLLLAPSLFTNVWQAFRGGHLRQLCAEFWPFLLPATLTVWLGVNLGQSLDVRWLSALLGMLLIGYAGYGLFAAQLRPRPGISRSNIVSKALSVLTGTTNGLLTGLTGSFVVPGVMYLQSRHLSRDRLIQAMGILFTLSTLALGVALASEQRINLPAAWISMAAIVPAILGMVLGQRLRQELSEKVFRRLFFHSLLLMGTYIIVGSLAIH